MRDNLVWYRDAIRRLARWLRLYTGIISAQKAEIKYLQELCEFRRKAAIESCVNRHKAKFYENRLTKAVRWIAGTSVLLVIVGVVMWVCFDFWSAFPLLLFAVFNFWAGVKLA